MPNEPTPLAYLIVENADSTWTVNGEYCFATATESVAYVRTVETLRSRILGQTAAYTVSFTVCTLLGRRIVEAVAKFRPRVDTEVFPQ